MSRKILPTKEGDISPWLQAFLETANANAPILALPADMTTALTAAQASLAAQQIAVQKAKNGTPRGGRNEKPNPARDRNRNHSGKPHRAEQPRRFRPP